MIFKSYRTSLCGRKAEKAKVNSSYYITMGMGRYQKYMPKSTNIAEQKTALLSIWNDLPQEFIDKCSEISCNVK